MRRIPLVASVAFVVAIAGSASADWPMSRHDAHRTGMASGTSDIKQPVPYWRAYLGGTLGQQAMLVADVDKDGIQDIVYAQGGRIFAKHVDDTVVWESVYTGVLTLNGIDDLNGDGELDVIGSSSDQVFVFRGRTGTLDWAEPAGEMGTIGAIRIGDLDGDKKPDVFIQECGCCGVNSGETGIAYSFGASTTAPKKLWKLPAVACGGRNTLTLLDVDGDGQLETTYATDTTISVLDGKTGTAIAATDALGTRTAYMLCTPANVDGVTGDELVCAQAEVAATPSGRRLSVFKYVKEPAPKLTTLWSKDIGDVNGAIELLRDGVGDFDGDGKVEIAVTGVSTSGAPEVVVLDAADGTALASLAGARLAGVVKADTGGKSLLVVGSGSTIGAHAFARTATPATALRWSLAERSLVRYPDPGFTRISQLASVPAALDLSGDGAAEVLVSVGSPATGLEAHATTATGSSSVGTYPLSVPAAAIWVTPPVGAPDRRIVVARSDGLLHVLDSKLIPALSGSGALHFGTQISPKAWTLTASPVVGSLGDGTTQAVLVKDGTNSLLRLDTATATIAVPPKVVFRRPETGAPAIVPGLDGGKPGIACRGLVTPVEDKPIHQVLALRADGTPIWNAKLPGIAFQDVLPGTFSDDGVPDLVVQWGNETDLLLRTRALNGTSGATLWESAPIDPKAGRQPAGYAVEDWNGDGMADVIYQGAGTRVLSGATGAEILTGGPSNAYYLPTLFDVDGDGSLEVTLHGSFWPLGTWRKDLKTKVWSSTADDRPFPWGAIAKCPSGPVMVHGSWAKPASLKVVSLSGSLAGTGSTLFLAGGAKHADEAAAVAAKVPLAQLTAASVHENLSGTSEPIAVVGSFSGWLYGVKPCTGELAFTYDFGAPLTEAVFGDTDGDGRDEIIVGAGDGYLYGLRDKELPAPAWIWDTDPAHAMTDADVDTTQATDSLSGRWAAVEGAESYEVAVLGAAGAPLTSPTWTNVGNVTSTTVPGIVLTAETRYVLAVRAIAGTKRSPDLPSDGVVLAFPTTDAGPADVGDIVYGGPDAAAPPPPEAGGGCGCSTPARHPYDARVAALALLGSMAALARRRPRR